MRYNTAALLSLTAALLLPGCITITGFRNGYKHLPPAERAHIHFAKGVQDFCSVPNDHHIYAINGQQLADCLKGKDTTLVYRWNPHCQSKVCMSLKYVQSICDQQHYDLYVVADYYDPQQTSVQSTAIQNPLLSVDHIYYRSDRRGKYTRLFMRDLLHGRRLPRSEDYFRYLLFRGDSLICPINDINDSTGRALLHRKAS